MVHVDGSSTDPAAGPEVLRCSCGSFSQLQDLRCLPPLGGTSARRPKPTEDARRGAACLSRGERGAGQGGGCIPKGIGEDSGGSLPTFVKDKWTTPPPGPLLRILKGCLLIVSTF